MEVIKWNWFRQMIVSALTLWLLAFCLGVYTWVWRTELFESAVGIAWQQLIIVLPRLPIALLAAGFLSVLIPEKLISSWIGAESGVVGVLLAVLVGALIPSGPIVSFPIAIALLKLGVGTPQLVALLTSWSLLQFNRLIIWEAPFLGWNFAWKRLLISAPLPFVAAGSALLIQWVISQ